MATRLTASLFALGTCLATPALAQDYYVPDYDAAEAIARDAEAAEAGAAAEAVEQARDIAQPRAAVPVPIDSAVPAAAQPSFVSYPVIQPVPTAAVSPDSGRRAERQISAPAESDSRRAERALATQSAPAAEEDLIEYVDRDGNVLGVYPANGPQPDWATPRAVAAPRTRPLGYTVQQRNDWLAECRRRLSRDNGVGGALIGGIVGGIAGNRIAGRGNRTLGTVAGAAVGATAGMAIDKAEDRGEARDQCLAYLEDYETRGTQYSPDQQPAGAYAAGQITYVPVVMVPMQMVRVRDGQILQPGE